MANPQDELEGLKTQVAALTARIYILEQRLGITAAAAPRPVAPPQPVTTTTTTTAPPKPVPPVTVPASTPPPSFATFSGSKLVSEIDSGASLERKIGQVWLNRIGIAAVLIGVSFFLKWAFDNNLIGAGGRVAIGLLAGIGIVVWSERFRRKNFVPFSYSLKAVGIGTLYLSLWGAAQYFDPPLISTQIAFALVGGFTTPVLVSTGQNHEIVLFCYVAILDLGVLVIAIQKPWRRLLWGSFIGTQILFWGWFADYYSRDQRLTTVIFAALFATIFAAIPLASRFERSTRFSGVSITLVVVPLLNAAGFFLALFEMYESEKATLTWYALALAAAYLGLSNAFKQRRAAAEGKIINLIHIAVAIAFITIAIPLKL